MADPKKPAGGTLFHVTLGESRFMYNVDMRMALSNPLGEWKERPWTEKEIEAFKRKSEASEPEAEDSDDKEKPRRGRPPKDRHAE